MVVFEVFIFNQNNKILHNCAIIMLTRLGLLNLYCAILDAPALSFWVLQYCGDR